MKEELENKLVEIAPYMFRYKGWNNMQQSLMGFGFEVNDGWYNLLEELITKLNEVDTYKTIRVFQVKEKFGTLRFYIDNTKELLPNSFIVFETIAEFINKITQFIRMFIGKFTGIYINLYIRHPYWKRIEKLIRIAEHKSAITCENCGEKGKVGGKGWLVTLCDKCRKKRKKD